MNVKKNNDSKPDMDDIPNGHWFFSNNRLFVKLKGEETFTEISKDNPLWTLLREM